MKDVIAHALVEACPDGQLALDVERRYVHWNAAMERMTGMPAAEVIGRSADEVFPFLAGSGAAREQERALRGETGSLRDGRFEVGRTGRSGWFDAVYTPLRDPSGAIVGALGFIRDTTARRLAEERLAETEQRFANMAAASPVLLWMSGTDSLCTFFNSTWLEFTGRTLEQEWGIGWAEGVHFEDLQRCLDLYEEAFNARRAFEMEYRLRRADGEYRWVLDRARPRYEPDGSFAGFIGSCTDITDRKALEVELRQKVRLRDEFLSIASHELRTPIASLRLQIESLLRHEERGQPLGDADRKRRTATVRSSVQRLEHLVDRLLDVSQLRASGLSLRPARFDLSDVVRVAVDRVREEVVRAGSALEVIAPSGVVGVWDRDRIEQVLVNLVQNAAKYGAGKPIRLEVGAEDGTARILVRDEGIGIAPSDQRRIFEPFERAVPSSSYGGLGLGLWISNEITRACGGHIDVQSAPGAGATFTVVLPQVEPRSGAPGLP